MELSSSMYTSVWKRRMCFEPMGKWEVLPAPFFFFTVRSQITNYELSTTIIDRLNALRKSLLIVILIAIMVSGLTLVVLCLLQIG